MSSEAVSKTPHTDLSGQFVTGGHGGPGERPTVTIRDFSGSSMYIVEHCTHAVLLVSKFRGLPMADAT